MLIEIIDALIFFITGLILKIGYLGIFILMALESMVTPIPSELVMPFAGFLVYTGDMNMVLVILAGTFGCVFGSLLSYYIGYLGGIPLVMKFGKYLLLNKHDLEITRSFFRKHGEKTIFISRFIPVVRHLISIPAGIGKMDLKKFVIFTFLGSLGWNTILTVAGYYLKQNWEIIHEKLRSFEIAIIMILLAVVILFVYYHVKRARKK